MKRLLTGAAVAVVVLAGGVAAAQVAKAPGPDTGRQSYSTSLRKFQKDTIALRDELAAKRADLQEELAQAAPDQSRVASLEKDIVDLQGKIDAAASRNGVRGWGPHHGRGMMFAANGGSGGCGCW